MKNLLTFILLVSASAAIAQEGFTVHLTQEYSDANSFRHKMSSEDPYEAKVIVHELLKEHNKDAAEIVGMLGHIRKSKRVGGDVAYHVFQKEKGFDLLEKYKRIKKPSRQLTDSLANFVKDPIVSIFVTYWGRNGTSIQDPILNFYFGDVEPGAKACFSGSRKTLLRDHGTGFRRVRPVSLNFSLIKCLEDSYTKIMQMIDDEIKKEQLEKDIFSIFQLDSEDQSVSQFDGGRENLDKEPQEFKTELSKSYSANLDA